MALTLEKLAAATASASSQEEFVRRWPFPVLVEEPDGKESQDPGVKVYPVHPKDRTRNDGPVSLGRKQHQDVVINDGMISSLHAHFTLEFDEGDERMFFYEDQGSSNGSWLNGEKLEHNHKVQVNNKDSLRLGPNVAVKFYTAGGIYLFLKFFRRNQSKD